MSENVVAITIENPCSEPSSFVVMLEKGVSLTMGRGSSSDITIPNPYISRAHMRVSWTDEDLFVHDLESTNGTRVNDLRVVGSKRINIGDQISICDVVLEVKPANDPEVVELKSKDQELKIGQDLYEGEPEEKRAKQKKALRKTVMLRAVDLKNAGLGLSRAETMNFKRPKNKGMSFAMSFAFIVLVVLGAWLIWKT